MKLFKSKKSDVRKFKREEEIRTVQQNAKDEGDPYLLEALQPQGGITFRDPRYIQTGSGYEACLHIYEYPRSLDDFWLAKLCNINNTIVTVDVSTEDTNDVKKNINKSMKEQQFRYMEAVDFQEKYDARQRFQEMETLYDELESMDKVMKTMKTRIFLFDRSWVGLEEQTKNVMASLEASSYRPTIFLNETKQEWTSMFKSYTDQQSEMFATYGQPMISDVLAAGNPFHFSNLDDPTGDFLGKTSIGGNVLFDEFLKTATRRHSNSLVIGTMGSGKSTLLKKRFHYNAARGNYIRTFDISGEFADLTRELGGKVLRLDGTGGILNPLEILKAEDDEGISFTRHISKVSTIYKYLVEGEADTEEIVEFEELLRGMYQKFGFVLGKSGRATGQITGLPARSYPTFSDLLIYIQEEMERIQNGTYTDLEARLQEENLKKIDKIRKVVQNIVFNYGSMFNGYTSIDNILDEQIVTFDISTLKDMKPSIFDAQLFNMLSLCWDNCVTNGKLMNDRVNLPDNDPLKIDPVDATKFLIIIDESHRWINTKKRQALESVTVYLRESRKYFGGIMMASQSIRDFVPEGSGAEEIDELKKVFELTQYKFIFHQDSNVLSLLDKVFENTLTVSQRATVPKLELGENILCISGDRNIQFKVYLTDEEERLFNGGV